MEWTIVLEYEGSPCGSATIRQDGLYMQVECECRPVTEQVVRVYLPSEGEPCCLGVLIPEDGRLCLSRRIAASRLPPPPYGTGTVAQSGNLWTPWSGEIDGVSIEGALSRRESGTRLVALPWQPGEPFPWLALAARCTPGTIENKTYLTISVDESGSSVKETIQAQ